MSVITPAMVPKARAFCQPGLLQNFDGIRVDGKGNLRIVSSRMFPRARVSGM